MTNEIVNKAAKSILDYMFEIEDQNTGQEPMSIEHGDTEYYIILTERPDDKTLRYSMYDRDDEDADRVVAQFDITYSPVKN